MILKFFIILRVQKHETNIYENFLQFECKLSIYKHETAKNHSPLSFIGGKYPPRHFGSTLTFTLTTMKKKQGKATVTMVEIPDALSDFNSENNVTRARLIFSFSSPTTDDDDDITSVLVARSGNQTYSVIIDITDMGENEKACLKAAKAAFEGKQATFTVFNWDVSELNDDGETVVNNGSREYSSLSDPYIGSNTDNESSLARMRRRLNNDIENGNLEYGPITHEEKPRNGNNSRRMR